MMNKNVLKIIAVAAFSLCATIFVACTGTGGAQIGTAQSPTDAYKQLFAAVKSKNTEDIKKMMSEATIALVEMQAAQTKQTTEKVFSNGLTGSTQSATLPQIRDERIKDNLGAVEVWNEKDRKWDDVPFINENGVWKLAVGDVFKGTYLEPPGVPQSVREKEAANLANPNMSNLQKIETANVNVNKSGPQPPMPSKKELEKQAEKK